jgi:AsmA family protein
MARTAKIAAMIAVTLAFLAIAGIVFLHLFDWNRMRPEIAGRLTEATGRTIEIRGDLDLRLSWRPEVIARDVTVANAEWGSQPDMATAEAVRLTFRVLPLLRGRIEEARVHLVRPRLLLETDGERTNWAFATDDDNEDATEEPEPVIERVSVENARVVYRSPKLKAPVEIDLEAGSYEVKSREFTLRDATAQMGENKAAGSLEGDFAENWPRADGRLRAEGPSLRAIGDVAGYPLPLDQPYRADLELSSGERSLRVRVIDARAGGNAIKGNLVIDFSAEAPYAIERVSAAGAQAVYQPPDLDESVEIDLEAASYDIRNQAFMLRDVTARMGENKAAGSIEGDFAESWPRADGRLRAEGPSLRAIGDLAGYPLPLDRPYSASVELSTGEQSTRVHIMEARIGDSDIEGEFIIDLSANVPHVKGKLSSKELRIDDIVEVLDQIDEQDKPRDQLLSDQPIPFDALDRVNAEIAFKGGAAWSGPLRIDGMRFDLTLEDGRLSIEPLTFDTAEGKIELELQVDPHKDAPEVSASLQVRGLNLKVLLAAFDAEDEAAGRVNGIVTVAGRGRSQREIGSSAQGDGFVLMTGGHVGKMVLAAIAVDLQEALLEWIRGGDTMVGINCAIMPLRMREGRLFADQWVFDTTDTLVETEGFLDLGTEEVQLVLMPYPKYFSLFNTLASITIEGDLGERTVDVSMLEIARNFVLKSLGAPLMPLVSPFIQEEAEERGPCGEMLSRLRGEEAAQPPQ